jgi:hypothetical protein
MPHSNERLSEAEALAILESRGIPRIAGASGEDEGTEPAPGIEQETPGYDESAEEGGFDESPDIDFEQRYNDLRPEFDRRSQALSQAEQMQEALSGMAGPEAQAQALMSLGIELEDDQDDYDYEDENPDARLDRLEQTIEEQQAMAEQEAYIEAEQNFLVEGIEALEEREGREFSEQEVAILASVARANRLDDGTPDLSLANDHLTDLLTERQKSWIESKRGGRRPGSGMAAGKAVDLNDPEARVQFMADRIEAAEVD